VPSEEIIVLACSKKLGGRCVAGISTESGRWVRPVSGRNHGELEPAQYRIDGRAPRPLDVVRLDLVERLDDLAQPENVLIDDEAPWRLVDSLDPAHAYARLRRHLSRGPRLFGNRGFAVHTDAAELGVEASLALVEPDSEAEFFLGRGREGKGPMRPRVGFGLRGSRYELVLTDFLVAPRVWELGEGVHSAADLGFPTASHVLITVSLGEPKGEWHPKLGAAVLLLP
jgi:hypothetical protein